MDQQSAPAPRPTTTPIGSIMGRSFETAEEAGEAAFKLVAHYTGAENRVRPDDFTALRTQAGAFIGVLLLQPPSPERSTAIAKVREALSWGIAGLVMPRG